MHFFWQRKQSTQRQARQSTTGMTHRALADAGAPVINALEKRMLFAVLSAPHGPRRASRLRQRDRSHVERLQR